MPLDPQTIRILGRALFAAEAERRQIPLISQRHDGLTLADAYAIQAEFVAAKRAAGATGRGWKIGLTSRAMQDALQIDTPDSGVLLDDMFFDTGAVIPAGRFIAPRIEAEIAFVMGADLDGPASPAQVLDATAYICPALEILDTRIIRRDRTTGRMRSVIDTIADNAANAGIVLGGQPRKPDAIDLRWIGAIVSRNATVMETGLGAGVLGDPLLGISWLSGRLAETGQTIRAGEVLLAGSFIRPIEAPAGSTIHGDFGAFGTVTCHFD
ncbi:2-oxo-hepta-3-ene-1,7-dioic acid hydratase (plasmid) [Tistrella bauzanensis]|uniref:2-oxo-hept-4-ene-1,7-dioate hydratase n=1 Tax=Tistrella arctica TaxID=3133430 RepID=A0ABU9YL07_9PROT